METNNNLEVKKATSLLDSVREIVESANKERGTNANESGWKSYALGSVILGYSVSEGVQVNLIGFRGNDSLQYEVTINNAGILKIIQYQTGESSGTELDPSDTDSVDVLSYLENLISGNMHAN